MIHDRETALDVVVVDDDPAVRDSLATIFEIEGFKVRTYGSADEFLTIGRRTKPDCLLLDVHMPMRSGLDVLEAIGGATYPAPVIMISGQADIPMAVAAIKAGAHDFVEKPFDAEAVTSMVREAVRVYRERSNSATRPPSSRRFPGAETLTAREIEVLDQIAQGASNKEAGRLLGISPRTIEVHRARIMEKLGARNTADLMRIVLSHDRH
jgi:two-component system, LuxR family, response regulator FixJ